MNGIHAVMEKKGGLLLLLRWDVLPVHHAVGEKKIRVDAESCHSFVYETRTRMRRPIGLYIHKETCWKDTQAEWAWSRLRMGAGLF